MKEFTELERDAWGGFINAWATINRIVEEDLQTTGQITHVEFEILLRLHWAKGHRMRIQDLAKQSLLTRSGTSRALSRLKKAGLVMRAVADEDRRGAYAILTEAGEQCFQKVAAPHIACVKANFTDQFSDEELKQMVVFWKRLGTLPVPKG